MLYTPIPHRLSSESTAICQIKQRRHETKPPKLVSGGVSFAAGGRGLTKQLSVNWTYGIFRTEIKKTRVKCTRYMALCRISEF